MRRRIAYPLACLLALLSGSDPSRAELQRPPVPPSSLKDPRLERLRLAANDWELRTQNRREVLDQVCLVPDLATFLEAIGSWDERHYFPILIEDVPNTLRFLRAFRPARIVRFPKRAAPPDAMNKWDAANRAVGRSWTSPNAGVETSREQPAQATPRAPGVVLSSPDSPSLAGGVALAAGRFQQLARLDFGKTFGDTLDSQGLNQFAIGVENAVSTVAKKHGELGDDCDFITLAGNWPYRYNAKDGPRCLDDLIGRSPSTLERWAFAGRLVNDEKTAVYQSMCSLFLTTESAVLFNSYPEQGAPWDDYKMLEAARTLKPLFAVEHFSGDNGATLESWHKAFDPRNRHGLVMINSKGGPTQFDMPGRGATTLDVPQTVPTAVIMIHSFSAAEPQNPGTIAGRWLANGAFVYHGSMQEPYLQSFRPPRLYASLIADRVPLGAALRAMEKEAFGQPWKLIYIGDPLYRVTPRNQARPRSEEYGKTKEWPAYQGTTPPRPDESVSRKLIWTLQSAMERTTRAGSQRPLSELVDVLGSIDRGQVDPTLRPLFDALLADVLYLGGWYQDLRTRVSQIPAPDRPESARSLAESSVVVELNRLPETDFNRALSLWSETFRLDLGMAVRTYATAFVGQRANTPSRQMAFRATLRSALEGVKRTESEGLLRSTLEQLEKAIGPARR